MTNQKNLDNKKSVLTDLKTYNFTLLQGQAYSLLQQNLSQELADFKLSIPEWKLLGQLYEHGQMRLVLLAEYLNYEPPMVTKLAKILEEKNLVQRLTDQTDERAKLISITKSGSQIVEISEIALKKSFTKLIKNLTEDELKNYQKVLETIVSNAKSYNCILLACLLQFS